MARNSMIDIDALLDAMTVDEQVGLLAGADFWTTVAVPRLGVPSIKVTDGPNGARGGGSLVGGVKSATATTTKSRSLRCSRSGTACPTPRSSTPTWRWILASFRRPAR